MILAANKILCEKSFSANKKAFYDLAESGCINEVGGTWQPNKVPSSLKSCIPTENDDERGRKRRY